MNNAALGLTWVELVVLCRLQNALTVLARVVATSVVEVELHGRIRVRESEAFGVPIQVSPRAVIRATTIWAWIAILNGEGSELYRTVDRHRHTTAEEADGFSTIFVSRFHRDACTRWPRT